MIFRFKNYTLRMPRPEDASGLVDISMDAEAMKYYGESGICRDLETAEREIRWFEEMFDQNGGRWIIVDEKEDVYAGDIGFSGYEEKHRRVELGYRLKREHWGKGIVSAFIGQLTEWGFRERSYNRIEALVDVRNPASAKVLLKNGFKPEGVLREYEYEHGEFVDLEMYSLLAGDRRR